MASPSPADERSQSKLARFRQNNNRRNAQSPTVEGGGSGFIDAPQASGMDLADYDEIAAEARQRLENLRQRILNSASSEFDDDEEPVGKGHQRQVQPSQGQERDRTSRTNSPPRQQADHSNQSRKSNPNPPSPTPSPAIVTVIAANASTMTDLSIEFLSDMEAHHTHRGLLMIQQLEQGGRSAAAMMEQEERTLIALRFHRNVVKANNELRIRLDDAISRCAQSEKALRCERRVVEELDKHNAAKEKWCAADVLSLQQQLEAEKESCNKALQAAKERRVKELEMVELSHRQEIAVYESRIEAMKEADARREQVLQRIKEDHRRLQDELREVVGHHRSLVAELATKGAPESTASSEGRSPSVPVQQQKKGKTMQEQSPHPSSGTAPPPGAQVKERSVQSSTHFNDPLDVTDDRQRTPPRRVQTHLSTSSTKSWNRHQDDDDIERSSIAASSIWGPAQDHPLRQGYLFLVDTAKGAWRKYFCILTKGRFLIGESPTSSFIPLFHVNSIVRLKSAPGAQETVRTMMGSRTQYIGFCFTVEHRETLKGAVKTIEIGSEDKCERHSWMEAIKGARGGGVAITNGTLVSNHASGDSPAPGSRSTSVAELRDRSPPSHQKRSFDEWHKRNDQRQEMLMKVHQIETNVRRSLSPS
jgi:hypothetical protein